MGADQPVEAAQELSDSELLGLLKQAAAEEAVRAWVVGGYVRDKLLGRPHPNPDVVVEDGGGERVAERFARLAGARRPVIFERFGTERVADELRKMLVSERPGRAMELLDGGGLLEVILPELAACKGVVQSGYHTHDVYGHTLLAVQATPADLIVRLAALFHDVGKPSTATADGAFTGHEEVGAELASGALTRLRFAQREIEVVARLVRLHLRPVYYSPEWKDGAVRRLARDAGAQLDRLMALARADLGASAYPDQGKLDELERRLDQVLSE